MILAVGHHRVVISRNAEGFNEKVKQAYGAVRIGRKGRRQKMHVSRKIRLDLALPECSFCTACFARALDVQRTLDLKLEIRLSSSIRVYPPLI